MPVNPDTPAPIGAPIVDALDPATMDLWRTVAKIAKTLDDQHMCFGILRPASGAPFCVECSELARDEPGFSTAHWSPCGETVLLFASPRFS